MRVISRFSHKSLLAFGAAILALLVVGAISYRGIVVSSASDRWVRHTHEVLDALKDLLVAMSSIESNARGFMISGGESYLESYRANILRVEQGTATIRNLTFDNPKQQSRLAALESLAARRIQRVQAVIELRRTEGLQAITNIDQLGLGKALMDEFQGVILELQDEELRLLKEREAEEERYVIRAKVLLVLGTGLGLLITATAGWGVQREYAGRALAEKTLRDSEEKYRMVLDGVQDYAIFMLDPHGQIVSWNAGAERIKGYTAEQIIGQNFSRFFAPEDIRDGRPQEVLRLTAANGRYEEQGMRVRKDGTRFLASVTFSALHDAAGHLRGFSEISHDLSARKESEARYRGLLEAAPDAMVVVNQRGEIVLLNAQAEKQFGYYRDELIGQKVKNIIPEGFAERLIADALRSTEDALAQQIGTGIELIALRKNGSEFPIELMLSPLESAEGILVTAAIRDITRRKKAEAHLLQKVQELNRSNEELGKSAKSASDANKELEAFAYSVSHDLRAPLRSVDGFSQVLLADYAGKLDEEGKDSLNRIRAASQRMGMLIDDMLSLSQVTRREIALARTDLSKMAAEIVAELRLGEPRRQVEFIAAPELITTTDPHLMRIALVNLLGNAWKFTGRRPQARIEFGTTDHEGRQAYFVADNGAGFDMAYAGKLFGAFQRMHSITEFEGTGIGLATVQRIIHRLGGQVWAEATPDHGATFYFALDDGGSA